MAPKRGARRAQGGASGAPARRSARLANDTPVAIVDDIEQVLRRTRRPATGRTPAQRGSTRGRGGRRGRGNGRGSTNEEGTPAASASSPDLAPAPETASTTGQPASADQYTDHANGTGPHETETRDQTTSAQTPATPSRPKADPSAPAVEHQEELAQQSTGEKADKSGEKADEPGKDGKRRSESPGHGQNSPKRSKTTDDEAQENNHQRQREQTEQKVSCEQLREAMGVYSAVRSPAGEEYINPITEGTMLEDTDVYRAIAAVSEAVTEGGQHIFSVMDPHTLQWARESGEGLIQTIARPRQEVLIPRCQGSHISLFVLQRDPSNPGSSTERFSMRNFDSAHSGHRGRLGEHYGDIRRSVLNAQWTGHGATPDDDVIEGYQAAENVVRQAASWTCGLHVIFNAWAYALGLTLSGRVERYDEFIARGVEIVRLAVQGQMNSHTLWAFFDCFGFIEANQEVAEGRQFEQTVAFANRAALPRHAARVRVREDLPSVPNALDFDLALHYFDDDPIDELPTWSAQTFAQETWIRHESRQGGPRTNVQAGETAEQRPAASEQTSQTPLGQTQEQIERDAAFAREQQQLLDASTDPERSSSQPSRDNMQVSDRPGPQTGPASNETVQESSTAAGGGPAHESQPPSGVRQRGMAATTSLLARLDPSLKPGTPEYAARQAARDAEREAQRQAAATHIAAAQASADAASASQAQQSGTDLSSAETTEPSAPSAEEDATQTNNEAALPSAPQDDDRDSLFDGSEPGDEQPESDSNDPGRYTEQNLRTLSGTDQTVEQPDADRRARSPSESPELDGQRPHDGGSSLEDILARHPPQDDGFGAGFSPAVSEGDDYDEDADIPAEFRTGNRRATYGPDRQEQEGQRSYDIDRAGSEERRERAMRSELLSGIENPDEQDEIFRDLQAALGQRDAQEDGRTGGNQQARSSFAHADGYGGGNTGYGVSGGYGDEQGDDDFDPDDYYN